MKNSGTDQSKILKKASQLSPKQSSRLGFKIVGWLMMIVGMTAIAGIVGMLVIGSILTEAIDKNRVVSPYESGPSYAERSAESSEQFAKTLETTAMAIFGGGCIVIGYLFINSGSKER